MGLIKDVLSAGMSAGSSAINSSIWKEYFVSGDMSKSVLMTRAQKVTNGKDVNTKADANLISSGALIDVQPNQCAVIVENGRVLDFVAEPGRFTWDASTTPSLLCGTNKGLKAVAQNFLDQLSTGGVRTSTQRLYFINTGQIWDPILWGCGNIPFETFIANDNMGQPISFSVTLKGHGSIRIRIVNPIDFYNEIGAQLAGGDNSGRITVESISDSIFRTAKSKISSGIATAISNLGQHHNVMYTAIPSYHMDIEENLLDILRATDICRAGFGFSDFVIDGALEIPDEDKQAIKDYKFKVANATGAVADHDYRMKMADSLGQVGKSEGTMGIMGMGMMLNSPMAAGLGVMAPGYINPNQQAYQNVPQQPVSQPASIYRNQPEAPSNPPTLQAAPTWTCSCGHQNTGKFCAECGAKQPEPVVADSWTCSCGKVNTGKFCPECGAKKPEAKKVLKCDKCGWVAPEGTVTKFCPECGDPVTENDFQ